MDSLMLGSLTLYKRILNDNLFNPILTPPSPRSLDVIAPNLSHAMEYTRPPLPIAGHALAGVMAGWTVSFIAAPVEHIKARLQIQYAVSKAQRTYSGPIDCFRKIYRSHSLPGLYHGLSATILFRTFFFVWWGSYDLIQRALQTQTSIPLSLPTVQFLAGGLSAQLFWCASYPSDVIKQRIMTSSLENRGRGMWRATATALYRQQGWKGFWRGFLPCFLRAFPANATALAAFEGVMRVLP